MAGRMTGRVLGIDPGLTRCGIAVVERGGTGDADAGLHLRLASVICTAADLPVQERLLQLDDALHRLLAEQRPDAVAVERVLFNANARTAMATGQASGLALLAAARAQVPVHTYTPTQVKLAVAGYGAADKVGLARMVAAQLGLDEPPHPADAADAAAVALCHLATGVLADQVASADGDTWEDVVARRGLRVVGGTGGVA